VLWTHHWKTAYDVNAADPIVVEDMIFISSGYQHGAAVITISPLKHNLAVKFLSHALYADMASFEAASKSGEVEARIRQLKAASQAGPDAQAAR